MSFPVWFSSLCERSVSWFKKGAGPLGMHPHLLRAHARDFHPSRPLACLSYAESREYRVPCLPYSQLSSRVTHWFQPRLPLEALNFTPALGMTHSPAHVTIGSWCLHLPVWGCVDRILHHTEGGIASKIIITTPNTMMTINPSLIYLSLLRV